MKESGKFNADKHLENLKKIDTEMGKLKGLVDEYNEIITKGNKDIIPRVRLYSVTSGGWVFDGEGEVVLISSSYGFIKRLVENNKIDASEIMLDDRMGTIYDKTDSTLMMLAIQDNPIEFLISILK